MRARREVNAHAHAEGRSNPNDAHGLFPNYSLEMVMRDFGPFRQAKCNKKEKREKRRRVRHKTTGELLLYYQNMCASVVRPPMYALKKQTLIMCCSIVDCPREQARQLQFVFYLRGDMYSSRANCFLVRRAR